jgi:putative NADPH-quinone reductase
MKKKITIILGNPDSDSYCASIASAYQNAAENSGHEVKLFKLGELEFDPILHKGYKEIQPVERSLQDAQEAIKWANHLVFVYPIWWGTMPSLLKGFFDRAFLPGYAFKYRPNSQFWDKLLTGRSAHVFSTMDTPPWYYWLIYKMPGHNQIKRTILEFSGIKPVKISSFGPVRFATDAQKEKWLAKVARYAFQLS